MKSLALISCLQKLQYLSFVTTPKWWVCSILQPFYMLQNYPGWLNCQQLSSRLCSATLGQVWILWEPAIGSSRPSLCNYKIHNYTFAILQNTANGFFSPTLENELIFEYFEFWQTISQNVWISLILWAVAGWWGWVMSHPEQRPSPASPHPALSFVVFQNREQQHLSSSLPTLQARMLCDLHVAGFHVAQIRFLFWWPGHWLTLVHSWASQSKQFAAILENQDPEGGGGEAGPRLQPTHCWPVSAGRCMPGVKSDGGAQ